MPSRKKLTVNGEVAATATSFARYIDPDTGEEEKVQVQGVARDPEVRLVNPDRDRGHLYCLCCDGKMNYTPPKKSIAGSTGTRDVGHFSSVGGHDEDCDLHKKDPHNFPKRDYTKGPRIDIDTVQVSETFAQASGVYVYKEGRKLLADEDLRNRPLEKVYKVGDVLQLIDRYLRADKEEQLQSARFVFQNRAQDWAQTIIRRGKPSRLADLVERVMKSPKEAEPPFAVVEVETTTYYNGSKERKDPANPKSRGRVPPAPVARQYIGKTPDGLEQYVQFDIHLNGPDRDFRQTAMFQPGTYWVMGEVRWHCSISNNLKEKGPASVVHYLNIRATDPRQVTLASAEGILERSAQPRQRPVKPDRETFLRDLYPLTGE